MGPVQVALCLASAGHKRSARDFVRLHEQFKPLMTQWKR